MNRRFGIDARWITREVSGIGCYTERLIHALSEIDSENQYYLFFCDSGMQDRFAGNFDYSKHSNFQPVLFPYKPFSLRGLFAINKEINKLKLDLFHSTNFMIPLFAGNVRLVATVHDLIPLLFPHFTPKAKKTRFYIIYKLLMKWIAKKADLVLADSEHSRKDIERGLHLNNDKVRRVYIGIEPNYQPKTEKEMPRSVREKYQIKKPYFLYVGRHDPYKNIDKLVQAYAAYLKDVPAGVNLVITGKRDSRYPEAYQWAEKENLLGKVIFTGYVSNEDLLELYRHALAVVLVSRYEGFGLPVLEAMACGVPVLCSNAASLPEVAGEAAILVSPDSEHEIIDGLKNLSLDRSLREELIQKGFQQVKKFTWEACARETLEAYRSLT